MGYDLLGFNKDEFRWTGSDWFRVLDLAQLFGWSPQGTINDEIKNWKGGYFSNDYQLVTKDDAKCLAGALKKALNNPEKVSIPDNLDSLLRGSSEDYLREFIDFCMNDAFVIS